MKRLIASALAALLFSGPASHAANSDQPTALDVPVGPVVGEPFRGVPFGLKVRSVIDSRELPASANPRDLVLDPRAIEKLGYVPRLSRSLEDVVRDAFESRFPTEGAMEVFEVDVEVRRLEFEKPGFLSYKYGLKADFAVYTDDLETLASMDFRGVAGAGARLHRFTDAAEEFAESVEAALDNVTSDYADALRNAWLRERPDAPRPNENLTDPFTPGFGPMVLRGLGYGGAGVLCAWLGAATLTLPIDEDDLDTALYVASGFYAVGTVYGVSRGNGHRGDGPWVLAAVAAAYAANVASFDVGSDAEQSGIFFASTAISTTVVALIVETLTTDESKEVFVAGDPEDQTKVDVEVGPTLVGGTGLALRGRF